MMDEYKLADIERARRAHHRALERGHARRGARMAARLVVVLDDDRRLRRADHARRRRSRSRRSGIDIDFTGTSAASSRNGINVPKSLHRRVHVVRRALRHRRARSRTTPGSLGVVRVSAPEGCILNAPFPLAGERAPHRRADAARRRVRVPAPGAARAGAGRRHLVRCGTCGSRAARRSRASTARDS